MLDATKPKLTPCEKIKNSKRIEFSQFSSKACNDINNYEIFPIHALLGCIDLFGAERWSQFTYVWGMF